MALITAAMLIDALLSAGMEVGLDRLADAVPAALTDAVANLRAEDKKTRLVRMEAIVRDAATAAAKEFHGQTDDQGRTLTAMLEHEPLILEATHLLLLGERPDIDRVRQRLLPLVPEETWQEQRRAVLRYLQELETRLNRDASWGPVLKSFNFEASLAGIDRNTLALAEQMEKLRGSVAELPEQTAAAIAKRLHPLDLNDLERAYLKGVYADCTHVPLAGDAPVDAPDKRPRLQRIYVDLDTETEPTFEQVFHRLGIPESERPFRLERWLNSQERKPPSNMVSSHLVVSAWMAAVERSDKKTADQLGVDVEDFNKALVPLTALDVLGFNPQSVLLGDPGSGKSTLTRRMAGNLAAGGLGTDDPTEQAWAAQLQTHFGRWLLPVRVVLSVWAQHLAPDAQGCAEDLVAECVRILAKTAKLDGPRQKEHFLARLAVQTPTALLLLDGLDEVADPAKRRTLLAAVRAFCTAYPQVPLVVTCRIRPYKEGKDYTLPLPAFTLAPLTPPAITTFLERWHAELTWAGFYTPEAAATAKNRLLSALDDSRRVELREMAETPLLLTMMARVNYGKGLPEGRAELYEEYVTQLLYEWERRKLDDQGQPTRLDEILKEGGVSRTPWIWPSTNWPSRSTARAGTGIPWTSPPTPCAPRWRPSTPAMRMRKPPGLCACCV